MTDSMKFGPEWLRSLSSDNSTMGVSSGGGGIRCQLAEYRYGREEMLALFEKGLPPPSSLCTFSSLYSEQSLPPLALVPATDEDRQWLARGPPMGTSVRGRGGSAGPADRGGRGARGGRGSYPSYGRSVGYESGGGWGNGEQSDWSPRKDFSYSRTPSSAMDNWRRTSRIEDEDGWRSGGRGSEKTVEKWSRSNSWREGDDDRGTQDKMGRSWHDGQRGGGGQQRRMWDDHDHLPEWATENLSEGGGTFDASGAFHGSDDEQDGKGKREQHHLQKSASQHTITTRTSHAPLSSSKSALSLSKPSEPPLPDHQEEGKDVVNHTNEPEKKGEAQKPPPSLSEPKQQQQQPVPVGLHEESNSVPPKQNSGAEESGGGGSRVVDEDFDKLQEDVMKLVVDEEPTNAVPPHIPHSNGVQPPPNMMPQLQEKWFYQDPQGDLQGPFCSSEMAEWFRAGYFSTTLYVRRQCDQTFYTLGELVGLCGGNNPFQTSAPIVPLKENKLAEDMLQYHQLMQAHLALRTPRPYGQGEPWNTLGNIQQRELMAQQLLAQSQIPPEPFLQQSNPGLIHMFNQINQVKMPVQQQVVEKPPNTIPCQLDPLQALVQQMGGLQQMQNRLPTAGAGQTLGAPAGLKHEPSLSALHGLPMNGMPGATVPVLPTGNMIGGGSMQNHPAGLGKMDGDGNMNFLQMFKKQQHQMEQNIDLEALWKRSQFTGQSNQTTPAPQWQQSDKPISMWDVPTPPNTNVVETTPPDVHQMNKENANMTKQKQANDAAASAAAAAAAAAAKEAAAKEEKKKKEAEERQAKKEAEEKRRQEQKRLDAEKKQQEEKKRKEEERVKRELEKAKKESEEKRLRELAEKRRLKEQRKAEEEARRKAEELRKQEELEREKLATKEREEQRKRQAEFARQTAEVLGNNQKPSRAAPWSQSTSNQGLSLAEIQKLERERKAEQALIQQQQRLQQSNEQANAAAAAAANVADKANNGLQLNWANKPVKHGQVKSLAEIQAEEQERLLKIKQANEKVMQQQKEKESLSPPTSRIWQANTLSWNQPETNAGFWDEPPKQSSNRANSEPKMRQNANSVNAQPAVKQAPNKPKAKSKKDEHSLNNNNNANVDEFADWCIKTLANMNTSVDVPTFITFLRDIESALDVRDYCREYLGDKPATQQFAAQFLEKRRLYKPKATAPKDDMCVPAPAITPSTQHNNDFQEVKGKGKKCKKSKMFKVDSRCLGFSVTASHDRINVGDRDYGDTT